MSETQPEIGTQLGPYLLRRKIGSGGMGTVYEAQDTVMDRVVALKLISGPYARDPAYRQRLQREARIAGRLQDPHVVPVHAAGEIDGQLFVDMRLINATDLDAVLRQSGPLPPVKAVSIVRQIASALDAAHAVGVLHRDVKPANILISPDDFAYLVDFGIANSATEIKLTQMGDVLGTWTYMAPERFRGDESQVTPRADTYALACVLVEALTGAPPFVGDTASLVGAHLSEAPPRLSARLGLPPALDDVIARGMAKDPAQRYATSGEFARAAEEALAGMGNATAAFTIPAAPAPAIPERPVQQPPVPQWQPPPAPYGYPPHGPTNYPAPQGLPKSSSRNRWILIAAAVVLVVAVAAGLAIWQLSSGSGPAPKNAVDITKLDVGHYGTKPRPFPGPTTVEDGRFLEAYRLAEGVANPYAVDPVLDHVYGSATPEPQTAATTISGTGTPLTQPVLEKYGMISGYFVEGVSKRINDFAREPSGDVLLILLSSFPNDDSAARAATEMDSVDFAVNPDNRTTKIPGYPQAKAHYRPGSPSVGATMASGRVVVSIAVRSDAHPDVSYLTQRIQRTLDIEQPLLSKLIPINNASLTTAQLDPDRMLSRLFVAGDQPKLSPTFGSMGPHAASFCADSQAQREGLFDEAGIDRCAFGVDAVLLRAKDESAAKAILPKLVDAEREEFIDHDVPAPTELPDARCYEQKKEIVADNANARFACFVGFGRYVATVSSNEENDVRQRAAAQYATLVNSA